MNNQIIITYTYQEDETGKTIDREYTLEEVEVGAQRLWEQGNWTIIKRALKGRANQKTTNSLTKEGLKEYETTGIIPSTTILDPSEDSP